MSLLTTNTAASSHQSKAANLFPSPAWKTPNNNNKNKNKKNKEKSPNCLIKMYQCWKLLIQNIESLTFASLLIKQKCLKPVIVQAEAQSTVYHPGNCGSETFYKETESEPPPLCYFIKASDAETLWLLGKRDGRALTKGQESGNFLDLPGKPCGKVQLLL